MTARTALLGLNGGGTGSSHPAPPVENTPIHTSSNQQDGDATGSSHPYAPPPEQGRPQ